MSACDAKKCKIHFYKHHRQQPGNETGNEKIYPEKAIFWTHQYCHVSPKKPELYCIFFSTIYWYSFIMCSFLIYISV